MASLFISYSRKDLEAARKLTGAFTGQDLDFWIDWEGIPPTVDWWKEIEKGIEQADIFLFLLSPDSCKSKVCAQEIEHAARNGKRLIPVVVRDVKAEDAPSQLRPLNWIFLREADPADAFQTGFEKLINAIRTDYVWVQFHRRLQVKALEWSRSNHENSLLLRGRDLQDAEMELARNTSKEPHPTDLQREYVLRSRQASDRQRRITTAIAIAGIIALAALAVFGFLQAGLARQAQATAEANASAAQTAQARAEQQAKIAFARQLAAQAQSTLEKDPTLSTLLSIESLRVSPELAGKQSLYDSLNAVGSTPTRVLSPFGQDAGFLYSRALSPDGRWLAAAMGPEGEDTILRLWDLQAPAAAPQVLYGPENGENRLLAFSSDGNWLASLSNNAIRLWDLRSHQLRLIRNSNSGILSFQFSPAGDRLATLSEDGNLRIYNLETPDAEPFLPPDQQNGVTSFAFSHDGHWIVAIMGGLHQTELPSGVVLGDGTDEGNLQLWNINSINSSPRKFAGALNPRGPLAISMDGTWIAGVRTDGNVQLWDTQTPAAEARVLQTSNELYFLAFHEHWLAGVSKSGTLQLWDVQLPDSASHLLFQSTDTIDLSAFSPDGRWIAIISSPYTGDYVVRLWDMQIPLAPPRLLHGSRSSFGLPMFSPNGIWLVTINQPGLLQEWDLRSFKEEPRILDNPENIDHFVFQPQGDWFIGVSKNSDVWLWNTQHLDEEPLRLKGLRPMPEEYSSNPVVFSPDGNWLAGGSGDGSIRLWNMQSPKSQPRILETAKGNIGLLAFSPDRAWLASLTDGVLQMWDMNSPARAAPFVGVQKDSFITLAFSPDSSWLVAASQSGPLWLWNTHDLASGPHILKPPAGQVTYFLAFRPDDKHFLGLAGDPASNSIVNEWNITSFAFSQLNFSNFDPSPDASQLTFSSDGNWLEAGAPTNPTPNIQLWDTMSPSKQISLHGKSSIGSVTFSQNDRWLVTGNTSNSLTSYFDPYIVQIWDLQSLATDPLILKTERATGADLPASLNEFLSQDNRWLLSASTNGDLRLWDLDQNLVIQHACQIIGRNFTRLEWAQYLLDEEYRATCPQWPLEPETAATSAGTGPTH